MHYRRQFPLLTGLLWGTAYPAVKVALDSFAPLQVAVIRVVVSTVLLGALLVAMGQRDVFRLERTELFPLALLSLFGISLFYVAQVYSTAFSTPINVAFIATTYPMFTGALAPWLLDERLRGRNVIGLLFGLVGAYVIIGNGRILPLFSSTTFLGDLIALGAALVFTVYLLASRYYTDRLELAHLTITFYMIALSVPVLVGALLVSGDTTVGTIDPIPGFAMAWLAVVVTVGGYLTLNMGLEAETTTMSALRLLSIPLVSTVVSVLLLNEALTLPKAVGGLAIIVGIGLPQLAPVFLGEGE